jgi:ERCC4-type nuclease
MRYALKVRVGNVRRTRSTQKSKDGTQKTEDRSQVTNRFIENVLILVDDRERPGGVAERPGKLSGVLVRIERLAVFDVPVFRSG